MLDVCMLQNYLSQIVSSFVEGQTSMTCVTALKVTVWAHLGFYELKGQIELEKNVLCVSCVLCV